MEDRKTDTAVKEREEGEVKKILHLIGGGNGKEWTPEHRKPASRLPVGLRMEGRLNGEGIGGEGKKQNHRGERVVPM